MTIIDKTIFLARLEDKHEIQLRPKNRPNAAHLLEIVDHPGFSKIFATDPVFDKTLFDLGELPRQRQSVGNYKPKLKLKFGFDFQINFFVIRR